MDRRSSMKLIGGAVAAAALVGARLGEPLQSGAAQTVEIPSGNLRLKAMLWTPKGAGPFPAVLFSHGSGDADADHTAGLTMTEAAGNLGPLFVKHG